MKQIIVDFLRRWWGGYLLAMLFVGILAALMDMEASFTFVGVLILPFVFEQGRRPFGVMTTLPVSRSVIALSYWCVAVILPVVLMTGSIALVALLLHSSAISLKDLAMILFGSWAFAGSVFCLLTFVSQVKGGSDSLVISLGTLWFFSCMLSIFHHEIREVTTQTSVVYLTGLIGLLVTLWGYSRSNKPLFGRATKYPGDGRHVAQSPKPIPAPQPGMARFGGFLFDTVWRGFLAGLLLSTFLLVFKVSINEDASIWPYVFTFGGLGSVGLMCEAMRFLRTLPLSARRLALTLLFMPLFSIVPIIAGVAMIKWFNPGLFLIPASLMIPMVGAVCCASSLMVRFGKNGYLFAMLLGLLASEVICKTVSDVKWPAVFWWLLGLCLMAAAFFLNRHWLRSSASYRPSTGGLLRR